ncbi:hypothetical protein JJD41_04405 [Oxynema sp. CENA135]|uniref:hypothetical protein n=1 Tax=Oxynema sp. CENA135 TaxID=984206 RepID=UPI00190ADE8F|nr:hypothetical protein [Oxynema sp. CENA135]MBK4729131.1 hypothetical protein [Oxynema sp. CENA135]
MNSILMSIAVRTTGDCKAIAAQTTTVQLSTIPLARFHNSRQRSPIDPGDRLDFA